jgi:hypothetical protein
MCSHYANRCALNRYQELYKRAVYFNESVLPVLEAAGLARQSMQLAWDFTTASSACQVTNSFCSYSINNTHCSISIRMQYSQQ